MAQTINIVFKLASYLEHELCYLTTNSWYAPMTAKMQIHMIAIPVINSKLRTKGTLDNNNLLLGFALDLHPIKLEVLK